MTSHSLIMRTCFKLQSDVLSRHLIRDGNRNAQGRELASLKQNETLSDSARLNEKGMRQPNKQPFPSKIECEACTM